MAFAQLSTPARRDWQNPRFHRQDALGDSGTWKYEYRFERMQSCIQPFSCPFYLPLGFPLGLIMSMHVFSVQHPSSSSKSQLRVLTGYENGGICLWAYFGQPDAVTIEGQGWEALWQVKPHVESGM